MGVVLHGLKFSVYTRAAQLVLIEKDVGFQVNEVNPFDPEQTDTMAKLTPFGRVPILDHDGMRIYETLAIAHYVNDAFDGPELVPADPLTKARMFQVISIVNSYAYLPLVRQVFSHRVFRPLMGEIGDKSTISKGLIASANVLAALDGFCEEALALNPDRLTLADVFLIPMIDYSTRAPEGSAMLSEYPHLSQWWAAVSQRTSVLQTRPDLASLRLEE
ncbi:MAG: glutathione S-transferase family protein [Rhodobacteraceae bacterium]|nr:glutathione S-transferase family protein [Paracoccaceae bacterium]